MNTKRPSTRAKDITGMIFGKLKAIELQTTRNKHGQRMWKCLCQCGNEKIIIQHSLTSGNTQTCGGCPNDYVVDGDIARINISTPKHPDTWTIIDKEDLVKVVPFVNNRGVQEKWCAHDSGWGCYAIGTRHSVKLHRVIVGAKGNQEIVDHINGDRLDNRKSNLRIVTPAENNKNMRKRVNNTSGYQGVYKDTHSELFVAEIHIGNKKLHIGRYDTLAEANIAYRAAAKALKFSERHGL